MGVSPRSAIGSMTGRRVDEPTLDVGNNMPEFEARHSSLALDELIKLLLLFPFRRVLMASFYLVALVILGVVFWKALVIAVIVFIALLAGFAERLLGRFGAVLLAYALAYWIDAAPAPAALRDTLMSAIQTAVGAVHSAKQ